MDSIEKQFVRAERLGHVSVALTLTAEAVAELVGIMAHERKALRVALKADGARNSEIACTLADHWTHKAHETISEAAGKRQVQTYVRAMNAARQAHRELLKEDATP